MVKKKNKLRSKTLNGVLTFRQEFNKQLTTAIAAGIGFLVALTWREPIGESITALIYFFGITNGELIFKYVFALLFTFIAVIPLVIIAKINSKDK